MSRNLPVSTNDLHVLGYTPSAAAAYIRLLHESLTQELARIRLDILTLQGDKSVKGISTLNKRRRRAKATATLLRRIENIATHEDMKGAYSRLSKVISHDSQWNAFISAAISLCGDYKEVQGGMRQQAEQMEEIAKAATHLALLLRSAESTGRMPESLTDANAVSVVDLVARVSSEYKPFTIGPFDAALAGRKRSRSADYIRAFAAALADAGFKIGPPVVHAIAIAASVCSDDGKVITYNDARGALNLSRRRDL
ncbi:MAG: hypothetical protein KA472_07370 [Pseudomonadales bacterium]|nr:hypothetical protein [Pseudomonadales bacterium]